MNLIICRTPLQSLIAERIIRLKKEEKFFLLYVVDIDNEKQRYYYNKLSGKVSCSEYIVLREYGMLSFYKFFNCLKLLCFFRKNFQYFDLVCFANLNDVYIWFILSRIKFNYIETFDDGSANIFYDGDYYTEYKMTPIRMVFFYFLRLKFSMKKIKELSMRHYTIYPNLRNVIDNTYPIYLFEEITSLSNRKRFDEISIFLGQPLIFNGIDYTKEIFDKVREYIDFDYYFPHPRETETHRLGINLIESNFIFEDYVIQLLLHESCEKYNVYTFFSSAILNLTQVNHINCNVIRVKGTILDEYDELYKIYEKIGVKVINI
ncbi:hypothetical protein A1D29_02695 [Pasteurellaceae bacterium Orientalotternb1]|nr:hypothetical protein A1D29_02695 [Pasteurellaceae bacterium Orientalotternb1]